MENDKNSIEQVARNLRQRLLDSRDEMGCWQGRLSSSAISTATAVFTLAMVDGDKYESMIRHGLDWLAENRNPDGGWGDTILSDSNISATLLCWSACAVARQPEFYADVVEDAQTWLKRYAGSLDAGHLAAALNARYGGKDRTFSVPILTMCALAGRLGGVAEAWGWVRPLPFELAALPRCLFRWMRLSVVSYALPALIAMGQVNFHFRRPGNPLARLLRRMTRRRTMRLLGRIQPSNGGFLEAIPLTSFVVMSMAEAGYPGSDVVARGVRFIVESARQDGSWPIDTNLATWITTLSVNAMAEGDGGPELSEQGRADICRCLLEQQYRQVHPYTGAAPGGWSWTSLPGAVPDADDSAGAIIAIYRLGRGDPVVRQAAIAGMNWLFGLQNRDGGIPTFCRGWGRLPFDRSGADLTAHALAGWGLWVNEFDGRVQRRIGRAMERAIAFLEADQRGDGAWLPLWFGNQHANAEANPLYGTARVISNLCLMPDEFVEACSDMLLAGARWIVDARNHSADSADNTDDNNNDGNDWGGWGGWGGDRDVPSSVEETALAVHALCSVMEHEVLAGRLADVEGGIVTTGRIKEGISCGVQWLTNNISCQGDLSPSPIGFYFAKLWYFEQLYPLIFTTAAISKATNHQSSIINHQ